MNPRRLITAAGVLLAAALLVAQVRALLADPAVWPPDDFVEYWAAARLALAGGNPYDPAQLLPLQREAGRATDEAVMMWNPPWALAAVLPLGLLPAREAQLLWLAANLLAAGWCGDRLWVRYGGDPARRWVGWAAALGFVPTLFALQSGQIGPLLLLGAVLFLEAERRGWPALAGAATVLLAIKPHLAYLVWAAIACDAVKSWWDRRPAGLPPDRRDAGPTRMLLGGAAAGVLATAVALAFDPRVLHQYADAMGNRPPDQWVSPTLGTVLRLLFGEERFGLQFVPVVVGVVWFAWHWRRAGRAWDWADQLPLLLLVSFATAPYGAWPFDLVLLLPAVVRLLAGGAPRAVVAGLLAVNAACLAMNAAQTGSFPFLWVAPALLALYVVGVRGGHPHVAPVPVGALA